MFNKLAKIYNIFFFKSMHFIQNIYQVCDFHPKRLKIFFFSFFSIWDSNYDLHRARQLDANFAKLWNAFFLNNELNKIVFFFSCFKETVVIPKPDDIGLYKKYHDLNSMLKIKNLVIMLMSIQILNAFLNYFLSP